MNCEERSATTVDGRGVDEKDLEWDKIKECK